jgi:hypothetical protein
LGRALSPRIALPAKPLLAFAIVLLPHAEDIFMCMENIQWVASLALIWVLISGDPTNLRERVSDYGAILLCGTTGVFSILVAPFYLLRALSRRTRESLIVAGLVCAVAALEAVFVVQGGRPLDAEHAAAFDPGLIPAVVGYRLISQLFGFKALLDLPIFVLGFAGLAALGALIAMALNPGPAESERRIRWMLCALAVPFAAAALYRFRNMELMLISPEHLARYFFIPQVVFVWLVVLEFHGGGRRRFVSGALLCAYVGTCLCFFRIPPLTDYHWRVYAPLIRSGQQYQIPVNPEGWVFRYSGPGM